MLASSALPIDTGAGSGPIGGSLAAVDVAVVSVVVVVVVVVIVVVDVVAVSVVVNDCDDGSSVAVIDVAVVESAD